MVSFHSNIQSDLFSQKNLVNSVKEKCHANLFPIRYSIWISQIKFYARINFIINDIDTYYFQIYSLFDLCLKIQ